MREKEIEQKLVRAVASMDGIAAKLVCPGLDGMPDRLILMPHGCIGFVELKAPGKKPRPLQLIRHRMLQDMGFMVYVIDDVKKIGGVLDEISAS